MADLLVPMLALGGLYVSLKKNKKEGFKSKFKASPSEFPVKNENSDYSPNEYNGGKTILEKHFSGKCKDNISEQGDNLTTSNSLTGEEIKICDFNHNNMVPFFGSRSNGSTPSYDGLLDNTQGQGSQHIKKTEQAPLFKPQTNLSFANGTPNNTDFIRSRMNPSNRMANVKPWEEERVAPGLNQGYTTEGSNLGFNTGMDQRDQWKPKSVDELRVETNPKLSFSLNGLEGAANSNIKESHNVSHLGKIENHAPDTYYENTSDRWLTTNGSEKRETQRGQEMLKDVTRPETSRNYFGTQRQNETSYVKGKYTETRRNQLECDELPKVNLKGGKHSGTHDYGNGSYRNNNNNRSTCNQEYIGLTGILKASVSPIVDMIKPTKKNELINNIRQEGFVNGSTRLNPLVHNENKTKTTTREQIECKLDNTHLNYQGQKRDGYQTYNTELLDVNRDTTSRQYEGGAGPAGVYNSQSYEAVYNQNNNENKEFESRANSGNMQLYNGNINATLKFDPQMDNREKIMNTTTNEFKPPLIGQNTLMNSKQDVEPLQNNRMNPEILNAFKDNPYTKGLDSWA